MEDTKKELDDVKTEAGSSTMTDAINLRVVNQDGNEMHFRIKKTAPLGKLMAAYCDRSNVAQGSVRFVYDGARLDSKDVPKMLDMEDDDVIDAVLEQTGGCTLPEY